MDANLKSLVGHTLMGIDGQRIGRISGIYVNSITNEPEWVAISQAGLFATRWVFAPVAHVTREGDHALVDYEKKFVKHAPGTHTESVLSPAENKELYRYYGIDHPGGAPGSHDWEWCSGVPTVITDHGVVAAFRRFLDEADPNDFDG